MRLWIALAGLAAVAGASAQAPAPVQTPGPGGIYTCVTADGRRLSADRPIPECQSQEQRQLNASGSVKRVVPPAQSLKERAAQEAREAELQRKREAQADLVRRDRNLLTRFKDEDAHQRARTSALDDITKATQMSERRLLELGKERTALQAQVAALKGQPVPPKLKHQLDANEAANEAQKQLIEHQKIELVRVTKRYDEELVRLKRLWAGAMPGSLDGPEPSPQ